MNIFYIHFVLKGNKDICIFAQMFDKFSKHIQDKEFITKNDKILLTVSGGLDSVVMTHLFFKLNYRVAIAHCNFNLRGDESDMDETFTKKLADKYKIPYFVKHFKTNKYAKEKGVSIQMAARDLRYDWFHQLSEENSFNIIVTAHHLDDQIETFFINLLRGTGISGLQGIQERNGKIIRPLLPFSKKELIEYAKKEKLTYREDKSNLDNYYLRNKIRNVLLPIIEDVNFDYRKTLSRTFNNLQQIKNLVDDYVITHKNKLQITENNIIYISISDLLNLKNSQLVLYELLKEFGFTGVQVETIHTILDRQSGKKFFSPSHQLLKDRNHLIISKINKKEHQVFTVNSIEELNSCSIGFESKLIDYSPHFNIFKEKRIALLDAEKLKFPVIIRKWEKGDFFYPLGMKGKKLLSDFFINEKISLNEKNKIWIMTSNNQIVWIVGHRIDNRYKIIKETKKILQIKYITGL